MNLLDCIELWVESLRSVFESFNISVTLKRTEDERPDHSCVVVLQRSGIEIEFIAWESGHGEFAITRDQGESSEEHLENLDNKKALASVLARILSEVYQN